MDILRKHLDKTCSTAVKEIQQVPSGLAIWPRDGLGLHLLTERKEALENCIQGAKAEVEQNWAIFTLPNAPQEYTSSDRTQVTHGPRGIQAKDRPLPSEVLLIKQEPTLWHPYHGHPRESSPDSPKRVHLYGKYVQIKRKPF